MGYDELLFWRGAMAGALGEAWLYRAPHGTAPGTSLCFWRKSWERKPFPDLPRIIAGKNVGTSEDVEWLKGLNLATMTSFCTSRPADGPRLIATIHRGNTMPYDNLEGSSSWRRVPEWDSYCQEKAAA